MSRVSLWGPLAPLGLALAALVFGLDQTHKWWMLHLYDIESREPVEITSFFQLVITWNRGISYGLFKTDLQGVLIAVSLGLCAMLWIWLCHSRTAVAAAALALVLGGALSNVLDRVVYGAVADFFLFHWGSFSWYVFNLADVAVVAGVALLLYESSFARQAT